MNSQGRPNGTQDEQAAIVAHGAEALAVAAEVRQARARLEELDRRAHVGHREADLAHLEQQLVPRGPLARDQLDEVPGRVEE